MGLYRTTAIVPIFFIFIYQIVCESTITINTQSGSIKGSILTSDHGNKFQAFRGIPYAQPPINSLRFMPPVASRPWDGILDATKDGHECLQINEFSTITSAAPLFGEEDCLILNIYRNEKYPSEKFPVIFYVHGGGYMSGSGSSLLYGPHRLMDRNVVLVTFNYRLGPFGFLSTSDEAAPGNYGLLDTVLALRWVQTNIADFGGDKNKVTIGGVSAGSGIVSLLILSPLAKGLFHGAIMQSGNALADWGFEYENPLNISVNLAKQLNCNTENTSKMIKCLQGIPAKEMLEKSTPLPGAPNDETPLYTFRPTVDKSRRSNAFLPHPPKQQLLKGEINIVPTISGTTGDEGLMFYIMPAIILNALNKNDSEMLPKLLAVGAPSLVHNAEKGKQAIKMIIKRFFRNEITDANRIKIMNEVFGGDSYASADNFNKLLVKRGALVYPYKFTYRGRHSWMDADSKMLPSGFISNLKMVAHGDCFQYLFRSKYFNDTNLYGKDAKMAELLITLWTNFAQSKIPYFEESYDDYQSEQNYLWNALDITNPQYLDINLESTMMRGHLCNDLHFWNTLYKFWEKSI